MKQRIVTGLIAAIALIAIVVYGSIHIISLAVTVAAGLGYMEFDRLFFLNRSHFRQLRVLILVVGTIFAMRMNIAFGWIALWFSFLTLAGVHVLTASRSGANTLEVRDLAFEVLGYLYVVSLLGFIMPIAELHDGRNYLMLLFIMVFVGDTSAYFAGTFLGKHTLAVRLSPKKSVEGAVAGAIGTTLVGGLWAYFLFPNGKEPSVYLRVALAATVVSILAQMGDLLESLFKRSKAQKDSGALLPGHGGILDRIDGLALAAPVYYAYLVFFLEHS